MVGEGKISFGSRTLSMSLAEGVEMSWFLPRRLSATSDPELGGTGEAVVAIKAPKARITPAMLARILDRFVVVMRDLRVWDLKLLG